MHRFNSKLALGGFIALCAAGAPSLAEDTAAVQPAASSSALSDVKVVRDENTKQLRAPTAEESAALDAKARTLAPTVVEVQRPVSTVESRADGSMVGNRSLAGATTAAAAEFVLVNTDGPGTGFNDATPATPVGGNSGTTVGEQRLIAYGRRLEHRGELSERSSAE